MTFYQHWLAISTNTVLHRNNIMNRAEIEQAVLTEIHTLPLDKVEATLHFVLSLKNQPVKKGH